MRVGEPCRVVSLADILGKDSSCKMPLGNWLITSNGAVRLQDKGAEGTLQGE